jgi:tripeptide aminopeptidase
MNTLQEPGILKEDGQRTRAIYQPLVERLVELAIQIQQIPAPTFQEHIRAKFVRDLFRQENLADVSLDQAGNVYGCLKGIGSKGEPGKDVQKPAVVVSAHLDTVFPAETDLTFRREKGRVFGAGIGVAGLLGLVWGLRQDEFSQNFPGDLWLVANVCEEGLGNLRGMRALVDRFGSEVLAYIVLEGMSLGQVFHGGLGVSRFRITTTTPGGHSWVDYGRPSAIHELAAFIMRLTALKLPQKPRTTLNVGVVKGGTSVNTIASQASIELDLRSESTRALSSLTGQVKDLVEESNRHNIGFTCELIGERPSGKIPASHPLVRIARRSLEAQGIKPGLSTGSTDANLPLSRGYPAVCIGLTRGAGAHTTREYFLTAPITQGMSQLHMLVETIFQELPENV